MDKLRAIEWFVRLADLGSFTRVAEEQDTSKSMISKEISRLEAELGARLIQRSTRHLQLTQVGEGYLQRCRALLMQLEDAESFVQDLQGEPKGRLKINAPMALGLTDLSRLFADFMQAYPQIELDIHLSDESVDLIEQGFDLGFRVASREFDSSYIGRPLKRFNYRICVAPAYLEQHGKIRRAEDLAQHNCFIYSYFRGKDVWPLGENGVQVSGSLRVNNTIFMLEAIKAGLGVGFMPEFICRDALAAGEVVEVLPRAAKPQLTLYALYPARQFVPPKLQLCIEFFQQWFKQN